MSNLRLFKARAIYATIVAVITITALLALPGYMLYSNIRTLIISELRNHAMNIAITTASFINEDVKPYKLLSATEEYAEGTYDTAYYNKMQSALQEIKQNTNVYFIYTEKHLSNSQIAYVLDGTDPNSDLFSPLGSVDNISDAEITAYKEGIATTTGLIHDSVWGTYLSGFAPIIDNETGSVIGLVGVDFSVNHIHNLMIEIRLVFIICFIALALISVFVIDRLLRLRRIAVDTDYLSGLYSKRYFESQLKLLIKSARTSGRPLSLIMIDVDDFKQINDNYGHPFGDRVLRSIAQVIKLHTRIVDVCARYAGDEFVIILPNTDIEQASLVGERIRDKVEHLSISPANMEPAKLSVSIGIAEWDQTMSADILTFNGDQAMYAAKTAGKNKVSIYKPL